MLAVILAIATAAGLDAQRIYSPDFSLGVKAGATFSEMAWSPSVRQKFTPGYTAGIIARYTEEKYFGLIGELRLTRRGWAENLPEESGLSYKRTFTYLELPVMTHIYFGSHKFRGFVNLGPQVNYMIGEKISANFDYNNVAGIKHYPANHRTEQLSLPVHTKFDYGICGGVGMEARIERKHSIMLEGRFYYGLANVFSAKRGETFGASRGMSIEITAAYMFRLQ